MTTDEAFNGHNCVVYVVDDDLSVRDGLDSLLRSVGIKVCPCSSSADFLQRHEHDLPGCLVLDVRLPGESGLDFQARLATMKISIPIVFITGHGDIPMSVKAMKAGATDFLVKPFREQDLLDAVVLALKQDSKLREARTVVAGLLSRYQTLSSREQEVMAHVAAGLMNKQIASRLGLSEITVKIHRGHAMKKMHARNVVEALKMFQIISNS
jgi:FixJ family two-component response regulator